MIKHALLAALLVLSSAAMAQDDGEEAPYAIVAHSDNVDDTSTYLLDINEEPCPKGSYVVVKAAEKAVVDRGCWVYDERNASVVIIWISTGIVERVAATDFYKGGSH